MHKIRCPMHSFDFEWCHSPVSISLQPFPVRLHHIFGTSHSSTTERVNGLVVVEYCGVKGFAEVGLPPKKPRCYESDIMDCYNFFEIFVSLISDELMHSEDGTIPHAVSDYDVFSSVPSQFFVALRSRNHSDVDSLCRMMLKCVDNVCDIDHCYPFRAPFCVFECAVLDLWTKHSELPVHVAIQSPERLCPPPYISYYTIAMNDNMDDFNDNAEFGAQYTCHFKLKLDSDVQKGEKILHSIRQFIVNRENKEDWTLSIDMNAALTPELMMEYLELFRKYRKCIYMVEQPFGLDFDGSSCENEKEKWKKVKDAYNNEGIFIYADESVRDEMDIKEFKPFVDGVNIKLEKAGGIRRALRAIFEAKQLGLRVWIGVMVGSTLNSTMAAQLLVEAGEGDLDGGLLVHMDRFSGGFSWDSNGYVVLPGFGKLQYDSSECGFGVQDL